VYRGDDVLQFDMHFSLQMGGVHRRGDTRAEQQEGHRVPAVGQPRAAQVSAIDCWSLFLLLLLLLVCFGHLAVCDEALCFDQTCPYEGEAFAMFLTTHIVLISICRCSGIDPKYNTMIKTSHPSPLGAYKTSSPFMGSKYGLFWL
jgi:hypothetical protein